MVTFTPLILLAVTFIKDKKASGKVAYFFLRCWGYGFSSCCLIFYQVHGRENLDPKQTYIFACNHSSFLDGIAICLAIPHDFRPLGKVELLKIPVFGLMYRHVVILINRNSNESRIQSMQEMHARLKSGISILIFPEGTMNKSENPLLPFKSGAFTLATETGAPVVPMIMHNSKVCMPRIPKYTLRPGIISVFFLPPLNTAGLNKIDTAELKTEVYLQIERQLKSGLPLSSSKH